MLRARAAGVLPIAGILPLAVAVLTALLSCLLPLAPVVVQTPEVRWPLEAAQPRSTVAMFMPYRPLDVTAEVPVATLRALDERTPAQERATAVATAVPGEARGRERALAVTVGDGRLEVRSSGRTLVSTPLDAADLGGGCTLRVRADAGGTGVTCGEAQLAAAPGLPVPEVVAFVTDVRDGAAGGPRVVAHPDARFESSPTPLKTALLLAHALLLVACLLLLVRADRPDPGRAPARARPVRASRGRRLAGLGADAAVVGGLAAWAVAGPVQTDDFYYSLEARSIGQTGYVGNVVRYFNVPEIPFTLQQYVLAGFAALSPAPVVLRLPSVLAGIGTWLLLTRLVLPRLVESPPWWLRPLAAAALLAWYLPFAVGGRPEALVVLVTTATLALALEAVARRRVWPLGAAAVLAGAAVAITASGALAALLLLVLAPRWWPLLRATRYGTAATGALLVACASVAAPAVFADATLAAALTALRVHDEVGPNLSWWMEPQRYWYLTQGPDPNQRLYSRQVAVLVTLVLLVGTSIALLRARRPRPARRTSWVVPAAVALAGYAVLALAPTKWSHHFGALAGVGTLAVVVGCVALVRRRPARWACLGLASAVAFITGLAMHGPDAQVEYSAYGTVAELPAVLGLPPLWLLLGGLLAAGVLLRRRTSRARDGSGDGDGTADVWPELVVLTTAAVLVSSLALQVLSVARATAVLRDTWSVAGSSLAALGEEDSCGFADVAVALTGTAALPPAAGAATGRGTPGGGTPAAAEAVAAPADAPAGTGAWRRAADAAPTAEVAGPWRRLGRLSATDVLTVQVRGDATGVVVDVAADDGTLLQTLPVQAAAGVDGWQVVRPAPLDALPGGAALVRTRLLGSAGEVAVTDPYRGTGRTLASVLPDDEAVLVDWPIGFDLPCLRPPRVAGGMVEPVDWFVQSATFENTPPLTMIDGGGSYATLPTVATLVPHRGFLPGAPYREWGNLVRVEYDLPRGGYAVVQDERVVPGWRWWEGAGPGPSPQQFLPVP